jgi:hypothetical protein
MVTRTGTKAGLETGIGNTFLLVSDASGLRRLCGPCRQGAKRGARQGRCGLKQGRKLDQRQDRNTVTTGKVGKAEQGSAKLRPSCDLGAASDRRRRLVGMDRQEYEYVPPLEKLNALSDDEISRALQRDDGATWRGPCRLFGLTSYGVAARTVERARWSS